MSILSFVVIGGWIVIMAVSFIIEAWIDDETDDYTVMVNTVCEEEEG